MKNLILATLSAVIVAMAMPAAAIQLGDPAPPLQIAEWAKGGPVDLAAGKGTQVFVVEFWATWCGPCRKTIPHLTEIQKAYRDKGVVVVGVSNEDAATVKPFVQEQAGQMDYTVAVDKNRQTSKAYMEAFGVRGIPHAFVIDKAGNLVWHGHPMEDIELVLDQVVAGTFNAGAFGQEAQLAAEMRELLPLWGMEYIVYSKYGRDTKAADDVGAKVLKHGAVMPDLLNQLAWHLMTEEGVAYKNGAFIEQVAKLAHEASGGANAAVMDTFAKALFQNGKVQEAVATQKAAIKAAAGNADEVKQLESSLKEYEAKLNGS
ncbi:MAG: redoxin domain-containing protein [bacterium]|nr:redoxin domain-containing protein [bacterium]